ncbi:MAG: alanine racemase [Myxococcales bacterium]|nr:alanine racemase [Myxococcales bacterium]
MRGTRPSYAEIDLEALAANYALAGRLARGREVIGVVKADAYGHGAVRVAQRLASLGCRTLAVVTVDEAEALRSAGVETQILVMGGVHDVLEAERAAALGATPAVHRSEDVRLVAEAAARAETVLAVQLEVDTGMSRMGAPAALAPEIARQIAERPELTFDGIYTHFARADEVETEPTFAQERLFAGVLDELDKRGIAPRQVHAAASAALLSGVGLPELARRFNAVRPGLMLYGIAPNPECGAPELAPVMRLVARIVALRRVAAGQGVGYGASYRAPAERSIATLPLGYADGFPRHFAQTAFVSHRGGDVPMVGRVSMDFVTLDLGDRPAEIGDEVVVFGPENPASRLAAAADTIAYELLVRVGARIPRVIVGEEV